MPRKTAGDRVRWLLEHHWNNNQSEMARETHCAQSTLSLVASGKNEPGKRLLTLISNHPQVNAEWLFHGKGKPISVEPEGFGSTRSSLPIVERALSGSPENVPSSLTDERQDVVPQLANPGSYILRVQGDEPIVHDIEMGIHPGDHLLVDTSPECIPPIDRLVRKLAVICHPDQRRKACLALLNYVPPSIDDGPERIEADTFDLGLRNEEIVRKKHVLDRDGRKQVITELFRRIRNGNESRLVPVSDLELEPPLHQIRYNDIMGICKMLIRKL